MSAQRTRMSREVRDFTVSDLELRADDAAGLRFNGTASVVDTAYEVSDRFGTFQETMATGAFNQTIKNGDIRLLVNHEGVPLARSKGGVGSLSLVADPHLRAATVFDPANPTVQELQSAIGRGDINQMSIGMQVRSDEWNTDYTERVIREAKLFDVSVVTFPASPTTTASLRAARLGDLPCVDDLRDALVELRAGALLSPAATAALTAVFTLIMEADEASDQAQTILADLLGVPDPDPAEPDEGGAAVNSNGDLTTLSANLSIEEWRLRIMRHKYAA